MFILQRDIINRTKILEGYWSQKPSSSRVLRSVPPSLTLLSVICWVPFWVVSNPFFSTNTRKSPSRDTWIKKVIWRKPCPPCGTSSSWPSAPAGPPSPACSPSSQVPKPSAPPPEKFIGWYFWNFQIKHFWAKSFSLDMCSMASDSGLILYQ